MRGNDNLVRRLCFLIDHRLGILECQLHLDAGPCNIDVESDGDEAVEESLSVGCVLGCLVPVLSAHLAKGHLVREQRRGHGEVGHLTSLKLHAASILVA